MKVNKSSHSHHLHEVQTAHGSPEEMVKVRKETLPRITEEVEKFLDDYTGGMMVITRLYYSKKTGKVTGNGSLVAGVDGIDGAVLLAYYANDTAKHLKAMVQDSVTKEELDAAMERVADRIAESDDEE